MNFEIEQKFIFENKENIVLELIKLGAIKKNTVFIEDTYFNLGGMTNKNDLLRIRTKNNKSEITFKGKNIGTKGIDERIEISTTIESKNKMIQIMKELNIDVIKESASDREFWKIAGCELVFIEYTKPAKLSYLEIESTNKDKIKELATKLNNLIKPASESMFSVFDK